MNKISYLKVLKIEEESLNGAPEFIAPSVSNDDILTELEARYGEITAWWILQRMPKAGK